MSENVEDFLEHHGVRGMKWGVRKSHNSGSGKSKKSGGAYPKNLRESADARHAKLAQQKIARGGLQTLNNKELQALVKRQNLEKQYTDLNPAKVSDGKKLAINILSTVGPLAITTALAMNKKYSMKSTKAPGTDLVLYNKQSISKRKFAETAFRTAADLAKQFGPQAAQVLVKTVIG